jgi:hypothetical protein
MPTEYQYLLADDTPLTFAIGVSEEPIGRLELDRPCPTTYPYGKYRATPCKKSVMSFALLQDICLMEKCVNAIIIVMVQACYDYIVVVYGLRDCTNYVVIQIT